MHILISWLIGHRIGSAVGRHNQETGNALVGIILWLFIGWVGGQAAAANLDNGWRMLGSLLALSAVLLFCLYRPSSSGFKLMMLNAITYLARLICVISGGYIVIRIGSAVIYGELKEQGLAALPIESLMQAGLWCLAAIASIAIIGLAFRRDDQRLQKLGLEPHQ